MGREGFQVTRLDAHILLAVDMGSLVRNRGEATVSERGRAHWLNKVNRALHRGMDGQTFEAPTQVVSAYSLTDRYGRSTFGAESPSTTLPLRVPVANTAARIAGALQWLAQSVKIGPSGALSIDFAVSLVPSSNALDVSDIVTAYHAIRRDADSEFLRLVTSLADVWNGMYELHEMFEIEPDLVRTAQIVAYDAVDFDFTIGGERVRPKELYAGDDSEALKALAGLSRMSSVYTSWDEASVRKMPPLDLGNRADELWFVNEARLLRHHPDTSTNPYVAAFYEDVLIGAELLLQKAASLIFLSSWVKARQSELLDRLLIAQSTREAVWVMREITLVLTQMSSIVSDPTRLDETSGHSFFRTIMSRMTERLGLESRREQLHGTFADLLALSQTVSGQTIAEASEDLQAQSLRVARGSRMWAIVACFVAFAAVAVSVASVINSGG